jgi:prepilin-type N-terminal cleavage/methylation domain-containing protein
MRGKQAAFTLVKLPTVSRSTALTTGKGFTLVEPPAVSDAKRPAFTLVELLVVITIIVVLLALLTPALDKAIYEAEKLQCLGRQRVLVQTCITYTFDHKKYYPPNAIRGKGMGTAYDIRQWWVDDEGTVPTPFAVNPAGTAAGPASPNLQLGLLPQAGYLPVGGLGKIMHCTNMDNLGNPNSSFGATVTGRYRGTGMDVIHDFGVGASWYNDPSKDALRIIIGYHYRAASWERNGKGLMRSVNMGSDDLITVDMPDQRFTGLAFGPGSITADTPEKLRAFTHWDGYGRSFADGHVSFRDDRNYDVAWAIYNRGSWGAHMAADTADAARLCEEIYTQYMNRN